MGLSKRRSDGGLGGTDARGDRAAHTARDARPGCLPGDAAALSAEARIGHGSRANAGTPEEYDVAYIPRGHLHEAIATSSVSLHITVGIPAYTWTDFLLESVADACLNDAAFRRALPPGFARDEVSETQTREILCHFGRRITFPVHVEPAIRFALGQKRFVIRDMPGDLDDSGKLTLARRLIREGLLAASPT